MILFGLALVGAAFFLNAMPSAGPRPGLVVVGGAIILAALTFL